MLLGGAGRGGGASPNQHSWKLGGIKESAKRPKKTTGISSGLRLKHLSELALNIFFQKCISEFGNHSLPFLASSAVTFTDPLSVLSKGKGNELC